MATKEESWRTERAELNQKLQDLLMHNEKVKDECLKKVLVFKDKYQDYKQKVKRANQQITLLTQRVARYELEKGIASQAHGASPDKASLHYANQNGTSEEGIDDYDQEAYEDDD